MNGRKISFDGWVLDRESGDLSRDGSRQRLQELPLKVLDLLLANPGGLVTREQLIGHLWPKGVVDFDTGLNTAVRKLRVALADIADAPRYIETIPRRGYRFIGLVDPDSPVVADPMPVPVLAPTVEEPRPRDEPTSAKESSLAAAGLPLQESTPEVPAVLGRPVVGPATWDRGIAYRRSSSIPDVVGGAPAAPIAVRARSAIGIDSRCSRYAGASAPVFAY